MKSPVINRAATIVSALVAAGVVLSACTAATGGNPAAAPPSAAPSATQPGGVTATGEEGAVETTFRSYYQALLARDFTTACALNAPETNAKLIENLAAQGTRTASCEEALTKIYGTSGAADIADAVANTAQIQAVTVDGDTATITWSAEVAGQRPTVTNTMRRIDGQWRLVDTSN